jgi:urease beta subunit
MIFFPLGLRYKAAVKADPLCYEVGRTVTQWQYYSFYEKKNMQYHVIIILIFPPFQITSHYNFLEESNHLKFDQNYT